MDVLHHAEEVHRSWKARFVETLERMEEAGPVPGPAPVSLPTLGAWLSEAAQCSLARTPEYLALRRDHERFYRLAGAVAILALKDGFAARVALESDPFTLAWHRLLDSLSAMRRVLERDPEVLRWPEAEACCA